MAWKMLDGYEMIIGLEVHVELKTRTKIFCSCPTTFGAPPNTQCCPVCLGMPGALPTLNAQTVHFAALAGLALQCKVTLNSKMDRKNYFYPDLPKAYQISQFDQPLCQNGHLNIMTAAGEKRIGITRIHLEEDAGKLIHEGGRTFIDCNRCGVPLIEIVSEPDMRTPEEAIAYLRKLRAVIAYTGISDCKMQEGSLRCDINLSIHKKNTPFGIRTEMKNLNSFQNVQRAIEAEYHRQVATLRRGEAVVQETRRFDPSTGETLPMRRKENAYDYRFFSDPDLPPIVLTSEQVEQWRRELPALPDNRKARYIKDFDLSAYAAEQLVSERRFADYFEEAAATTEAVRTLANLMISEAFRLLDSEDAAIPIPPEHFAQIAELVDDGAISIGTARKAVAAIWNSEDKPEVYIEREKLWQLRDEAAIAGFVHDAIAGHPEMVDAYKKGKVSLKNALMGAAMRLSGGRADPMLLRKIMDEALENI